MKISVICPTYNSELYIQRTINALLEQTLKPHEVIFSDDGSNDNTIEIIKKNAEIFKNKNIKKILVLNEHSGPGKSRNIGMQNATGEWFAFLDSDDTWEKNKLERISYYFKTNKNINVFLNWEKFYKNNNKIISLRHGQNYNLKENLTEQLYKRNFFSTSAVVIHRSIYSKFGGFDEFLPNAQDYDYWLKISTGVRLFIINEFLGNYYETKGNITQRPYRKKINSLLKISYRYKNNVRYFLFIKKLLQLTLSREWIKGLVN